MVEVRRALNGTARAAQADTISRRGRTVGLPICFVVAVLSFQIWASDRITWEGERTVYAVRCQRGAWQGRHCTGAVATAERYRFRVRRNEGQVVFWIEGAGTRGTLTHCSIHDGRNWTCAGAVGARPIIRQMKDGRPRQDPGAAEEQLHTLSKLDWWLVRFGFGALHDAEV